MAALAWLLIPVAAAIVAAVWARWAARHRTVGDVAELAGYERFREAMERSRVGSAPEGTLEPAPASASAESVVAATPMSIEPAAQAGEGSRAVPVAAPATAPARVTATAPDSDAAA